MANAHLRADSVRCKPTSQPLNLRIAVSAAIRRHGISPTRFGRNAIGDPALYRDIMNRGRELRPRTESKVRAYIATLDLGMGL
jgi:hypothetical protein